MIRNLWLSLLSMACTGIVIPFSAIAQADDWRQWMGVTGDGIYYEKGIVESIPAGGLPVKWRHEIAGGYAGPSVANGRVYVFDYVKSSGEVMNDPSVRAQLGGSERLLCLDEKTGKELWKYEYECPYSISYPVGPRCTPTVDISGEGDEGRVYLLGSEGDFACLNATTGEVLWKKSFKNDYKAVVPIWGFASHPLVDGDLVYCMVGGDGQTVVAFDKLTGEERWKALSAREPGYCPPSIIEEGGVRQLIVWHSEAIVSLDLATGKEYWKHPIAPDFAMAIAKPQLEGNLLYASAIRNNSVLLDLNEQEPAAKEVWSYTKRGSLFAANSTPIFHNGTIYGTDCNEGCLKAIDAKDGKELWRTFDATRFGEKRRLSHGTGFLTRIDGTDRYLILSEIGDLIMARLTPEKYEELGRFKAVEPTSEAFGRTVVWSHPAYANRTAYIRNDKEIVAIDLAQ